VLCKLALFDSLELAFFTTVGEEVLTGVALSTICIASLYFFIMCFNPAFEFDNLWPKNSSFDDG